MILPNDHSNQYIEDYAAGKIKKGLGIDCELDEFLRYKPGQFNVINGRDNVGKTVWMVWYYLVLSYKHGLKWVIYSGENKAEQLVRQLIEFYNTRKLRETDKKDVYAAKAFIDEHFSFVDYTGFYKPKDLFDCFGSTEADGALIDPYSGLDQSFGYEDNLTFLNDARHFVNNTGKTLYLNTHITSEADRMVWGQDVPDETLLGYPKPPNKSHSEGGTRFSARADDFLSIHRYLGHPIYGTKTLIFTRKIRDTESGGQVCPLNSPIYFDWNYGCGFKVSGINPLNDKDSNRDYTDNYETKAPF